MSVARIIADSDGEDDHYTSEAAPLTTTLSPTTTVPPFSHVGRQCPILGSRPVGTAIVAPSEDATRLTSTRSNSTDPAFFTALYAREQRAALGQDSSLLLATLGSADATAKIKANSQHTMDGSPALLNGGNLSGKRAAASETSTSLTDCNATSKRPCLGDSHKDAGARTSQGSIRALPENHNPKIPPTASLTDSPMDPWEVPDDSQRQWGQYNNKFMKPLRPEPIDRRRLDSHTFSLGFGGAMHSHQWQRVNASRQTTAHSMVDELSLDPDDMAMAGPGGVPDIGGLRPTIPSTASDTANFRPIYVEPSVLTESQRRQYREVSITPSPTKGSETDISFDNPGTLPGNLNRPTTGIYSNLAPSSCAPTVKCSTPSDFISSGLGPPPIEDTMVLSSLRPKPMVQEPTGKGHMRNDIPSTLEFTPQRPKGTLKITADLSATKKRKSEWRRDSSPDIILVEEAQRLGSAHFEGGIKKPASTSQGGVDMYAFDSSPPVAPAKKRRSIMPFVDQRPSAQPHDCGPQLSITMAIPLTTRAQEPIDVLSQWQPAPAPMAVMEVSRSTEETVALGVITGLGEDQPQPHDTFQQPEESEQQFDEPSRSGRSVHDQIADSEDDEDDGDFPAAPFVLALVEPTTQGKEIIPDTQSFSSHDPVTQTLIELHPEEPAMPHDKELVPKKKKNTSTKKAPVKKQKTRSKASVLRKEAEVAKSADQEPTPQRIQKLTDIITISDDESSGDELARDSTPMSAPAPVLEQVTQARAKPEVDSKSRATLTPEPEPEPEPEPPAGKAKDTTKKSTTKKTAKKKAVSKKGTGKAKPSVTPDVAVTVEIPEPELDEPEPKIVVSPAPETVAPKPPIETPLPEPAAKQPAVPTSQQRRSESVISATAVKPTGSISASGSEQATPEADPPAVKASPAKPAVTPLAARPVYRVGLSRKSRIAPLLKIVRKT
ncbi:hypothetical protein BROUX41_000523 [Berkeleyomyces rouxiae]|uniref:uncharacterized protein n=1 Tax=Berkeleyomyces rouxiae TaxID=2035830 RepID=UPI003B77ECDC